MKQTLLLITFAFGLGYSAFAAPCTDSTLAVYDATGFSCTIGDISFSNFSYTPSGSITIPAGSVAVTPETVGGETGFQFNAPWAVNPGDNTDSFIDFTATCDGCAIDDLVLEEGGASAGPGGLVNIAENSSVLTGSLTVGANSSTTILSDMATFPPVGSVTVSKDIAVIGGTSGLGSQVSSVTNLFSTSTVPEPSLTILCAGLLGLLPIARRRFVR